MFNLIQTATASQSNEQRKQAEKAILQLRQKNPQQFFREIIEVFMNNQSLQSVRQASGTLIAVSILAKTKVGQLIWDTLSDDMKNHIKNSNLAVLIDPDRNVRRAAANIVSAICYIELPRNQWGEIAQRICDNISHENEIVKQASILTLGFICSRMKERYDYTFPTKTQEHILSGIILGIQQTQQHLIETSLKALRDSLSSLATTLENDKVRTFLLTKMADMVSNQAYRVEILHIIGQFVQTCYQYLNSYIEGLITLLSPYINNSSDEDSCIAAMEVWESVAASYKQNDDEGKNLPNFISGKYGQIIVALLLKNLIIMKDSEDSDENPVSDSASRALETIFENGSQEYKDLVLQFVRVSISQADWKHRQASIKAFSLLLYGLSESVSEELISASINELMGLLGDSSVQVQYAAFESLTIITQISGKFILKSQNMIQYLQAIFSKLGISEKFLKSGCKIIDNLCAAEKQSKSAYFNPISDDLISIFLKFALANESSLSTITWSTTTIMNIIEISNNHTVIKKYLALILQNFDNLLKNIDDSEKKDVLISSFFTIIQYCLHGLKNQKLEQNIIEVIYTKVVSYFTKIGDVCTDGLYAIEALVYFFEGNKAILDNFWGYITHALTKWQDPGLFKATASCIASFVNCYMQQFGGDKLQTFVPGLIELLENPSFSKELKLDCLVILGEVFLCCQNQVLKYLPKLLQVIMLCCSAALQIAQTDFSYSEQLKDSIIQTLMCIIHGLNTENTVNNQLIPHIPNIFQFIFISCNKKNRPTVNYLKRCLLLMADFSNFYPAEVRPLKQQTFIRQYISTFKSFNKNHQYDKEIKYIESKLK